MDWIQQWQSKLNKQNGVAPLVRTGGSRHTGLAALPHRNIHGHIEKANRNKKLHLFACKNCGYKSNDDRIGAMNLYRMGINYLEDSQVPNTVMAE